MIYHENSSGELVKYGKHPQGTILLNHTNIATKI